MHAKPLVAIASAAILVLGVIAYVKSFPKVEEQHFIDIQTGRRKVVHKSGMFLLTIDTKIASTAISRELGFNDLSNPSPEGDWRLFNRFVDGSKISRRYLWMSAMLQVLELSLWWDALNYSEEARQETAQRLLTLWQFHDDPSEGDRFVEELKKLEIENVELSDVVQILDRFFTPKPSDLMPTPSVSPLPIDSASNSPRAAAQAASPTQSPTSATLSPSTPEGPAPTATPTTAPTSLPPTVAPSTDPSETAKLPRGNTASAD